MKSRVFFLALGLLFTGVCAAAEYSLNDGSVQFSAPGDWTAIMQKIEGDPQFFAFQVRNPDAPGTLTRVSINTRRVGDMAAFRAYVDKAVRDAASSKGYEAGPDNSAGTASLRYSADEDGQRQVYREDYFYHSGMVVTLRCVRPQNAPATAAWLHAYEQACAGIAVDLAR